MAIGPNVTGWAELMDADVVGASFTMFDTAFAGLIVAMLFLVFHIMLWYKTKNLGICFVTTMIFIGVFFTTGLNNIVHPATYGFIFVVVAFELGGIFYSIFFK
jgi:hypothetical protein